MTREELIQQILAGRGMRGSAAYGGGIITQQQLDALPEWLRSQFQARYDNDDNGTTFRGFENYDLRDEAGNPFRQINEANMAGDPRHNNNWSDPSRVRYDDALGLGTDPENMTDTPDASFTNGLRLTQILVALMAAGGALGAGGAGAFEGAAAEGALSGGPFAGATAEGAVSGLAGGIDPSLLEGINTGPSSFVDPALAETPGITPGSSGNPFDGMTGTATGEVSGPGFLASNANPLMRGGVALASMLAGNKPGGGSGGGGGGGAGTTNPLDIINAMANANRVNQTTPFGSRTWSQGADGQWSVADALSPEEQANYEGVRGMNANVTQMAQQRLAQLMAGTGRQRADRPLMFNGRTLGG